MRPPSVSWKSVAKWDWFSIIGPVLAGTLFLFLTLWVTPAHADPPPGIQEYFVLGYESHIYRMYKHGGVSDDDLPQFDTGRGYMASIVDVTVTADNQIIFYDHWEDGYDLDFANPSKTGNITGTLILGDGNPDNGSASDFIPGRTTDILKAGDSLPFSSRYEVEGASAITGYIPIDPRQASDFRFDGGDRIISTGGPIGLVHAMWPVRKNTDGTFTNHTLMGDSWEIYSSQVLQNAKVYEYVTPIGEDLAGNLFENVDLQVQALEDTWVTIKNGAGGEVEFGLKQGETYFSGDGTGYINSDVYSSTLNLDVYAGTTIVADNPIQVGVVAYHHNSNGFQDRFYNMIPQSLWDKQYIMPTGDHPVGTGNNADGNAQVYIYNPNPFEISIISADTNGSNDAFPVAPKSVVSYQEATGASTLRDAIPTLSGLSLKSDAHFWAIHAADANPNDGITYDWGNTFLPLFFLTDEYYASWAPGNVLLPPKQNACNGDGNTSGGQLCRNGSPLWVTAVEDDTQVNVDYDNNGTVDESFILDALEVMMLRDDIDFDQSSAHIWTKHGQKIAVIWGEDAVEAGRSSPNLDVGHLVLPLAQEWVDPAYAFEKSASPESVPMAGGTVTFGLKATASYSDSVEIENMVFIDTLPVDWTYVGGSTVITYPDGSTGPLEPTISTKTSTIAGSQTVTQTVLFWDLGTNLTPKQSVALQFQATISNPNGSIGPRHFDGFESNTYDDGTGPWLDNWTETGEPTNPTSGNILVTDNTVVNPYSGNRQLLIVGGDHAIDRGIDLSDFARPILRFKRYLQNVNQADDEFRLEISSDGGASYTPVFSWTNSSLQGTWLQEEIDLSPYLAPAARLRFASTASTETDDYLYLDDVEVLDDFVVNTNQATAKAQYEGYDYVVQARKNVYLNPFSLKKEANVETVALGSTIVFTLTYSNSSDSIIGSNFEIKDTLPAGLNFVSASDGGEYITKTNTVKWTIGDILPGTQGRVVLITTLDNTIRPEDGESVVNAANLFNNEYFVRSNNVGLTVRAPKLEVVKSAPSSASPGETITYTIYYENKGSISASNTFITDTIPANVTYIQGSCSGGCMTSANGLTLTWHLGDISPGDSGVVSFRVKISDTVPLGTNIQNVALVDHNALAAPEKVFANTYVSDIKLNKEASSTLVGPGQILTFTLNYQSIADTSAFIFDTIPAHTRYITASATSQSGVITPAYSTDGINYQTSEPSPASSVTHLRWAVTLISDTTDSVSFSVEVDDDLANDVTIDNQAKLDYLTNEIFSNQVSIPTVKLSLDKIGPDIVEAGDTFTYTLRFSNSGSGDATVILSDTLPANLNFISASPVPSSTNPIMWDFTLPANTYDVEYTIVVSVPNDTPAGTRFENKATLSSAQHTTIAVDSSLSTLVGGGLTSRKFATDLNGPPLLVSDTIRYAVVVTNTATAITHTNVTIYDTLPVSVTFVSGSETITPPGGSIDYLPGPHAISATVPSLEPQQVAVVTFNVTLNPDTVGQSITNTAIISSNEQIPFSTDVVIISNGGCMPDTYESDDNETLAPMFDFAPYNTYAISQSHTFHLPSDQDWIKLAVRPGAQYEFATSNLGPLADTQLILYAADGATVLAQNDDAQADVQYSRINWTAPLTPLNQSVYLVALQTPYNAPSCDTGYTLSLTQTVGGDLNGSEKMVNLPSVDLTVGDPLTYTITVINSDPLFSTAPVTVTDTLPTTITLVSVQTCGMSGQIEQYQFVTHTTGFTWVGAIGANAQVNLCIDGIVAVTPAASINTVWIRWNSQVISRSAEFGPEPSPDDTGIFLPIIFKNH